jgi:fatty acid desaturase
MDTSNRSIVDVRQSMLPFGRTMPSPLYNLTQRALTWATGKALPGQRPIKGGLSPWAHLAMMLVMLFAGAATSIALWRAGGWYLVLVLGSVGLTLSASRTLWLMDLHAAAHGSFSKSRWANKLVGDTVSLVLMVLPHSKYRQSHCADHHSPKTFCSADKDPDGSFLCWMGLAPATPKQNLWRRLLLGLISPRVHLTFLAARLKSNLFSSGWRRSLVSVFYLAVLACIPARYGWTAFFISWLLPIAFLYQVSAIVGWAGEHTWFAAKTDDMEAWHNARTHARFFGLPFPDNSSLARLWWIIRMFGEVIVRALIVPGDLANHDWHHRHPSSRDWPWAAYARQDAIEGGESYSLETWGLIQAIDRGLTSIAAQKPLREEGPRTLEAMSAFGTM